MIRALPLFYEGDTIHLMSRPTGLLSSLFGDENA